MRITRRVLTASLLAMTLAAPAFAADKPLILHFRSGPELSVLRPHDEGRSRPRRTSWASTSIESDGQVSSPKQTADIEAAIAKGVNGIVICPNEVDAMAPALQEAVDAKVPVVTIDRRVPTGAGHPRAMSAPTTSRAARRRANLIVKLFPNGATIMNLQGQSGREPGDRPQQGPAQRARQGQATNTRSCSSRPPASTAPRACR